MATDSQQAGVVDDAVRNQTNTAKVPTEEPSTSDNDGGERPVRKKLRDTTITSAPNSTTADASVDDAQKDDSSRASSRGRKRSFDEDDPEKKDAYSGASEEAGHRRKRSRDSNPEDLDSGDAAKSESNTGDAERKILSPKKKRSRDQVDKDEPKGHGVVEKPEEKDSSEAASSLEKPLAEGEPEKKRHRDDSRERDIATNSKPAITSAFSNTSTVSPFGALPTSKEEDPSKKNVTTSSSAFASSSLAAFAGSEQSPFGAIGSSTTSVFKKPEETTGEKPATTGFAAAEGPSPFASAGTSGFGALGSGFGGFAAAGKPGGLTSFASPGGPSLLGSTSKAKPFGAPDEEEEENEEATDSGPGEFEQEKTDERFFEQEITTGEEEEKTYFSSKAKLFQFSDKEWRERGIGTFKVNLKQSDNKDEKLPPRLIMRADGVLRVMLNTPIFKGMTVGDASGNEPKSKQIHLASLESGRSVPILLRMPTEDLAKELYHVVRGFLDNM
ncbi:hypothetical protein PHISCL_01840 [Aspergillus sclerotialis]|uniref:RanBD1 domain-containing protein n=1 Tax=Aspergillus sclerotialis TaxID=2070753 RepID=A0A3A3A280_9EURO|nr:hypothetical protein PHISCL_01840 [Aspergillus sclerotialis]